MHVNNCGYIYSFLECCHISGLSLRGSAVFARLQVEQSVLEGLVQSSFSLQAEVLSHHVRQLVGVLARSRHAHGSRPVVVNMRKFVTQLLQVVDLPLVFVVPERHVVCGRHRALSHVLRDEEEVLPESANKIIKTYFMFVSLRSILCLVRQSHMSGRVTV